MFEFEMEFYELQNWFDFFQKAPLIQYWCNFSTVACVCVLVLVRVRYSEVASICCHIVSIEQVFYQVVDFRCSAPRTQFLSIRPYE